MFRCFLGILTQFDCCEDCIDAMSFNNMIIDKHESPGNSLTTIVIAQIVILLLIVENLAYVAGRSCRSVYALTC